MKNMKESTTDRGCRRMDQWSQREDSGNHPTGKEKKNCFERSIT